VVERERGIKNSLAATSTEVRGTLAIACASVVRQRFLPSILARFTNMFPNGSIGLGTGMSGDIKHDHNKCHGTITRGEKSKDNTSILLFKDPLYIFDTEKFKKKQLKDRPLISFKSDDSLQDLINHWLFYQQKEINALQKISVDQI